jgi:hypothetical protein
MVSKALYDRLIEDRPFKLAESEVNYRLAQGEECCENCIHFYTRQVDKFHTCEIFRPKDERSVVPEYVCDFFSADGEEFPLLEPKTDR